MTTIRFVFDMKNPAITWGDLATIQRMRDGELDVVKLQKLAARCMVDENNQYLPHKRAMDILEDLPQEEMRDALTRFSNAVKDSAVPPTNGNSSEQPLEVKPPSEFPPGSEQ